MGMLVDGKWETNPIVTSDAQGNFVRRESSFRNWIRQDGSSGFKAEANRYHLYISYACPWASRVLIFRAIKGFEEIISYSSVEPLMRDNGWEFGTSDTQDPLYHKKYLYEIYQMADPHYSGKVTVPILWDKNKKTIVSNESAEIIRMLNNEFNTFASNPQDFYPTELRTQIDEINTFVYDAINNGVYKCGFAKTQTAYDNAVTTLFSALDTLEKRLSQQRYLVANQLTEADWRLFTTLIRFDIVYYNHFKCNIKRIQDYPHLLKYLRELYYLPRIKETVNFLHIKQHYFTSHSFINPTGIVPKGPSMEWL